MARKSRKHLNTETVMRSTPKENVGYIRLSVSNKEKYNSIENQKSIIKHWAEQHQLFISRFYIDNGFSGTTFERPGFKNIIQDIADGKIGCLIVKDLSRLGREFITTSYYIEEFFPTKKIRFVSVNDRFNTIDGITDVREEDVFSAVYYQLKLYLQDRRSDLAQRRQEMEKLRGNLAQQIEFQEVVTENPMLYYEQYVMGEITVDEFRAGQEKIRHAAEDRRAIEYKIEKCEQEHRQFSRLCEVRDKHLPLSTLMEEIDSITVDTGRKITVQWKNTEVF